MNDVFFPLKYVLCICTDYDFFLRHDCILAYGSFAFIGLRYSSNWGFWTITKLSVLKEHIAWSESCSAEFPLPERQHDTIGTISAPHYLWRMFVVQKIRWISRKLNCKAVEWRRLLVWKAVCCALVRTGCGKRAVWGGVVEGTCTCASEHFQGCTDSSGEIVQLELAQSCAQGLFHSCWCGRQGAHSCRRWVLPWMATAIFKFQVELCLSRWNGWG